MGKKCFLVNEKALKTDFKPFLVNEKALKMIFRPFSTVRK